MNKSQ